MIRQLIRLSGPVIIVILVAFSSMALLPGRPVIIVRTHTITPTTGKTSQTTTVTATSLPQTTTPTPRRIKPTLTRRPIQNLTSTITPTPAPTRPKPTLAPATQAGNSDGIILIGILIVGIIVIPIMLRRKEWRGD